MITSSLVLLAVLLGNVHSNPLPLLQDFTVDPSAQHSLQRLMSSKSVAHVPASAAQTSLSLSLERPPPKAARNGFQAKSMGGGNHGTMSDLDSILESYPVILAAGTTAYCESWSVWTHVPGHARVLACFGSVNVMPLIRIYALLPGEMPTILPGAVNVSIPYNGQVHNEDLIFRVTFCDTVASSIGNTSGGHVHVKCGASFGSACIGQIPESYVCDPVQHPFSNAGDHQRLWGPVITHQVLPLAVLSNSGRVMGFGITTHAGMSFTPGVFARVQTLITTDGSNFAPYYLSGPCSQSLCALRPVGDIPNWIADQCSAATEHDSEF